MLNLKMLGRKKNMATYRPSKYDDDEIRRTLIIAELSYAQNCYVISRWDFNPCIFPEL